MDKKIRVGVIGAGSLGQHHARNYFNIEDCELTCIADVNSAAKKTADDYKAGFFSDYRNTLDMVDAVSIVVPTTLHYEVARFFLENGKHVLLEKPITATAKEAKRLLKLHKKNKGLVFQVGHIERFNEAVKKMQEMRKVPILIEASRLGPFTARSLDVSVILDLMIHDIDIILQLVGSKVKKTEAIGVPLLSNSADMASARLEFENGAVANVAASRISPKRLRKIRIFENNAYMSIDYIRQSIKIYKVEESLPKNKALSWNDMTEVESFPLENEEENLAKELKSFLKSIREGGNPEVTAVQAYEALKIVLEVEKQVNKKLKSHPV
ncbi:MAG: Gfo/Idh/MocA family oxidoreductase [Candidatus Goldiibacteriota bacterium]